MENNPFIKTFKINKIKNKLDRIYTKYGYINIDLPTFEYYDILKNTTKDFADENIIRFIDRNSGKSMVLRPDFTPQICKNVAHYLPELPLPIKLYYHGNIFRNVYENKGLKSETSQSGVEILGIPEFATELELLSLINDIINTFHLNDVYIIFGDLKLLNIILSLIPSYKDKYMELLKNKDFLSIRSLFNDIVIDKKIKNFLIELPMIIGKPSIIKELIKIADFNNDIEERLHELFDFFHILEEKLDPLFNIIFDASELRGLNYYTGINYDIVIKDRGITLGGGGRYDNLMSIFNHDVKACGFALNLDLLSDYYNQKFTKNKIDYLIIGEKNIDQLFRLRKKGCSALLINHEDEINNLENLYTFSNVIK
ncbi:MAG: ATP phosphoribosyltransferase regulatory subunit [Deferribacterota bacterium]|nr:ATP phosphoribosyltransferase regulatory subunit [Deferribacterota bacterium]